MENQGFIMTEIVFYSIDIDINSFLFNFFNQLIFKNEKNILLYSDSLDKLKKMDIVLWELGKDIDFLPHSIFNEKNEFQKYERLLLTNKFINFNEADYLILSKFLDNSEFINCFEKVFYVFTNLNSKSIEQARMNFEKYKKLDYKVILNAKDNNGKWTEFNSL